MFHPRLTILPLTVALALSAGCYSGPPRPWFHKHGNTMPTTAGCEGCDAAGGMAGVSEGPILGDPTVFVQPGSGIPPTNGGLPPGAIPVPSENGGRLVPQPGVPPLASPPNGGRLVPMPQAQPEPFRP
jgi:hypothetical protein